MIVCSGAECQITRDKNSQPPHIRCFGVSSLFAHYVRCHFWEPEPCKPVWQTTESAWGPDAIECQTSKRYKSQLPKARTGKCLILNAPIHVASNPMEGCRSSTSKVKTLDAEAESRNMKLQTANLKPCNCTTAPAKQRAGAGQLRFETQDMVELSEQYLAPLLVSHGSTAAQPSCA